MPLDLTIVTPSGRAYRGDVDSVVLPGSEGDFGVLPGHERFLSAPRTGEVQIDTGGQKLYAAAPRVADVPASRSRCSSTRASSRATSTPRAQLAVQRCEQGLAACDRDSEAARIAEFEALERAQPPRRESAEVVRAP
jgi:F-type H+-transporting ATPase subunit epsilon